MGKQMEHKEFLELMQFYLYDELDIAKKNMFDAHLKSCNECSKEFEAFKEFISSLSDEIDKDVDPALLQDARSELRGYIRASKFNNSNNNSVLDFLKNIIYKPAGLAFGGLSLLLIGVFSGYLLFKESNIITDNNQNLNSDQYKIQNINFIDSDPADGKVEFTFESLTPGHIKGDINNPEIQNILSYALLTEQNPGTRLNSINVINATNSTKMDEEIKQTFISVAKFDVNPGVRREALKALSETQVDNEIKDALIYVLLNDTSSGIRIEAINNLISASKKGIRLSQNDLTILKEKMSSDNNNYVRFQAKNILKEY